jgi:dihydrofolate reductase
MMHVGLSRLYVTRIKKAFACDVFFPVISSSAWTTMRDEQVPHEEQVTYLLCRGGYFLLPFNE